MGPAELISRLRYKPGWQFRLGGPLDRYLCVFATTPDSSKPGERCTQHMFEIPDVLDEHEFYRWVFARLLECERHEAGEFFQVGDRRPFYPNHQDAGSPYELVERWEP
jgi:hypothetical protein